MAYLDLHARILLTLPKHARVITFIFLSHFAIFSDISERNNDYSDTLDFRRELGEMGVVTFFVQEVPDYEFAMLIYLYIHTHP